MWKELVNNFGKEYVHSAITAKQAYGLRERGHPEGQTLAVVSV